jgi:thiol-disulfide isomerase/thioredoxin
MAQQDREKGVSKRPRECHHECNSQGDGVSGPLLVTRPPDSPFQQGVCYTPFPNLMEEPNANKKPRSLSKMHRLVPVLILTVALSAHAAKFKKVVGQDFPATNTSCVATDHAVDVQSILKDDKYKGVAVIFTSYNCPVAVAYEERMNKLVEEYGDKIFFLYLNANASETAEGMKEYAEKEGLKGVFGMDKESKTALALGAGVTPEVYLVNKEGKIVFHGPVDDSQDPAFIENHYLRDGIKAVLAGEEISEDKREAQAFGCGIKFPKK